MKDLRTKLDAFLKEVDVNRDRFFPDSELIVIGERVNFLKLRIKLRKNLFLDIYFNSENDRKDFTLIHKRKRIFGYDNVKDWHLHPLDNPENHIKCKEPSIKKILEDVAKILVKLKG